MIEHPRCGAAHLGRQSNGGAIDDARQRCPAPVQLAEQRAGRQPYIVEPQLAGFAGLIDRGQQGHAQAGRVLRHQKQADAVLHRAAVACASRDDDDIGQMRVGDKHLRARQREPAACLARARGDPGGVPARVRLGPGERRLGLAGGDARQPLAALCRRAGLGDRRAAEQHGGRIGSGHHGAADLLHQHDQVGEAEPAAAIWLRERRSRASRYRPAGARIPA